MADMNDKGKQDLRMKQGGVPSPAQRTTSRIMVTDDRKERAGVRDSRSAKTRGARSTSQSGSSARKKRVSGTASHASPVDGTIIRNRIIAVVVLIIAIVLLVNLVTCAAGAIGGKQEQSSDSSSSEASSGGLVSMVAQNAPEQTAPVVPTGVGVEDPWVEGGRFSTGDADLDQIVKGFCDDNSKEGLSAEDNAFNVYCYAMWTEFIERDDNQHPTGPNWDITYAKQIMTEDGGNCYEQVAIGEYILKYFGYYDAQAEPCYILRQSGEYGDHGLLYVTNKDGRKCLCDPAFGANGWMLDADIYTVKVVDVGQDPAEFTIANFEEVVKAPWIDA